MLVLTHNCDDKELAHEQHEVGDLVHHGEANDVAQDETERRECRHAEVLAIDGTLQQAINAWWSSRYISRCSRKAKWLSCHYIIIIIDIILVKCQEIFCPYL